MSLTTRYLIDSWCGIDDDAFDVIIPQVSAAIESYLGRTIGTATYRQWLDGTGQVDLTLPEWPITTVYGVATSAVAVLTVKNTSGKFATLSSDSTGVTLFSVSIAGVETETSLPFATYATVTSLASAIAAVSGWTATIETGKDTEPSTLIRPNSGSWALSPDTVTLEIADQTENVHVNIQTDRMIRRAGGITASSRDWDLTELVFPEGTANVFVWWKAGYTLPVDNSGHTALTTVGTVPYDLTMVANIASKALYDFAEQDMAADSMSLGGLNYSLGDGNRGIVDKVLKDHRNTLGKYQRFL